MIESTRPDVKNDADKILNLLLASTPERRNKAIRIGICGAPGAIDLKDHLVQLRYVLTPKVLDRSVFPALALLHSYLLASLCLSL